MTILQAQLIPPTPLTNALATYLTAPTKTTYRLGRVGFANVTGGAVSVTVNLVPAGGSASAANEIMNAVSIASGSTYISPELAGLVMPQGSTLQIIASSSSAVNIYASGTSIQ